MKKILNLALILAVMLFASSCARVEDPSSKEIQQKLDALMEGTMSEYKAPGMILAVWVPGKEPYVKAKGLADINAGKKLKASDRFRIGSNTKIFTATVILQLVDEGKLKLDDKLSKFYPFVPNSENITIKMLLNHTSGLFNYSEGEEFDRILEADIIHPFTPRQLVDFAVKNKPYFPPGKGFHYSNTNTVLLGMIVGKVTGIPLEQQIKNRFIDKLALKNTYFPRDSETGGEISCGYMLNEKGKIEDWTKMNVSWGWAAGAMISNIYDLKTFVTAVTDGKLLSSGLQRERMSSWTELSGKGRVDFPSARYGYNVFTFGGFIGHNGGLPGCISYVVRNPKNGVTLIMMMNIQPQDNEASLKVLKEVIGIVCPGTKV
jgi:D-alanyl-D-alanine carboxypeptidase